MPAEVPVNAFGNNSQGPAEIIFGLTALAVLAYCVSVARSERKLWPLFVYLGASVAFVYEPINNVLAHCVYATRDQHTLVTMNGRDIPVMTLFLYLTYFPLGITFLMRRFQAGITKAQMWRYYAIGVAIAALFEPLICNGDLGLTWWYYYGNQVLNFTGLPMWWWFVNPLCWFGPAAIFHLLRTHAFAGDDRKSAVFFPGVLLATFATHASAAVPMFLAISSNASDAVQVTCTALSASIAFGYIWAMSATICVPAPGKAAARSPSPAVARAMPA